MRWLVYSDKLPGRPTKGERQYWTDKNKDSNGFRQHWDSRFDRAKVVDESDSNFFVGNWPLEQIKQTGTAYDLFFIPAENEIIIEVEY